MKRATAESIEQELADVLQRHFPEVSESGALQASRKLLRQKAIAKAIQDLSHNDGDPESDKLELEKLSNSLKRAASQLRKVEYHGARALQANYSISPVDIPADSAIDLRDELANNLDKLAVWVTAAKTATPSIGYSTAEIFGEDEGWGEGRPKGRKVVARLVAETCADTFEELAGKKPGNTTDPARGDHSGPFLELVKDVFSFFEIDASAQTWAIKAAQLKKNSE